MSTGGTLPARLTSHLGTAILLATIPWAEAHAKEALTDHLSQNWFYTEVVVFQRPAVLDYGAEEELAQRPVPLPATVRSLRQPPDQRWSAYQIHPSTRAFLSFPSVDQSLLPGALEPAQLEFPAPGTRPDEDLRTARTPDQVGNESATVPPPVTPQLAPDPVLDFLRRLAEYEASLEADSYRWLEPSTFTLAGEARRLGRRGGHQVLLHLRWLQPVPARENPQPLYVQAGPRFGDTFALEGTFEVTLGRYLHFRTGLYYVEPLLGHAPVNHGLPPPTGGPVPGTGAAPALTERDLTPRGFMQLRESRRMRSGELHYLDHPKLGVLVRIEPVTPPDALSAAHVALEEGEQ